MKKLVFILLLLVPFFVSAECNYNKHEEYSNFAKNLTYDNTYSKSSRRYNITIYNVINGMYASYDGRKYYPDSENVVTITNVPQGKTAVIDIYGNDGCNPVRVFSISELYYNDFFGSNLCIGYENKIKACSSEFTSSEITEDKLKEIIDNYNNVIITDKEKEEKEEVTFIEKVKDFMLSWGIKIILFAVTCGIFIPFYNEKFRRMEHGI